MREAVFARVVRRSGLEFADRTRRVFDGARSLPASGRDRRNLDFWNEEIFETESLEVGNGLVSAVERFLLGTAQELVAFLVEFLDVESKPEQLGWIVAAGIVQPERRLSGVSENRVRG